MNEQIDVWGFRTPFLFLEWIGMNAMLVFVMAAQGIFAAFINGWYYETPDNSLVSIIVVYSLGNLILCIYMTTLEKPDYLEYYLMA